MWNAPGAKVKRVANLPMPIEIDFIRSIVTEKLDSEDPFFVLDMGVVKNLMDKWNHTLPDIKPYYAVKCNPEPTFLRALSTLGAGFDCASQAEIKAVLGLGISADQIVYAHPCKAEGHIKYAASVGVKVTTYDCLHEVEKIKKWHPECALLLRIKPGNDGDSRCPLGSKYGASAEEVIPLLQAAHAAQLRVVGVSFYVRSANMHEQAYHSAILAAKAVFDSALQLGMPKMSMLNIGGGFSVGPQFEDAAVTIRSVIASNFGNEQGLEVISEPGRFFAETAFTLVTNIIGKRVRGDVREYWINDGIYGSMNCILNGNGILTAPTPLACNSNPSNLTCDGEKTYLSTVFGPTCTAIDTILTDYQLPELQVGDWLVFPNMGAYMASGGTRFNGFDTLAIPTFVAHFERSNEEIMYGKKIL